MTHPADRPLPEDVERFAFEGEDSYERAYEVAELTDDIAMDVRKSRPWVAYQLGSAGLSVMNNTAEGRGEKAPGDKARFYRYACRSANEVAGMIVFLGRKAIIPLDVEIRARRLLVDIMKLLTRRAIHFQRVRHRPRSTPAKSPTRRSP